MGHSSGLYREFESSLLLATMTNMTCRSYTGKRSIDITLRLSAPRYSHLFYGRIRLGSR
jgi:hypothetical protein